MLTRLLIALLLLAGLAAAGRWAYTTIYDAGAASCVAAHKQASEKTRADTEKRRDTAVASASSVRKASADAVGVATDKTKETVRVITRIVHDTPATAVCVLPADSLRELQTAVDRANTAARGSLR